MGQQPTDAELADCVAFASVENMRKLEEKSAFWLAGSRMRPATRANPDSFKVRRAKVGGYRDYFDDAQLAEIDAMTEERLLPGLRLPRAPSGRAGPRPRPAPDRRRRDRGNVLCNRSSRAATPEIDRHEAMRLHPHQPQAVSRRAGVAALDAAQLARIADEFDVKLIEYETYQDFFAKYEGRTYSRDGDNRVWDNEDLQSFTPLRFMPPELMGYEGRAVVVDPDVFAVGDIWELLSATCRARRSCAGTRRHAAPHYASSVMLLDCAKLRHWSWPRTSTRCSRASATTRTG